MKATMNARIAALIDWLNERWANCERCDLSDYRQNIVLGTFGTSGLMLLGEAPGADEDLQGVPFVGRAGKLLRACAKHARLSLDGASITNILACRPPGNRVPRDNETTACGNRVRGIFKVIQPDLVIVLGGTAAQWLLKRHILVTKEHGIVENYAIAGWSGAALVTYHPAYVLRQPGAEPSFEADLARGRRLLWERQRTVEAIKDIG